MRKEEEEEDYIEQRFAAVFSVQETAHASCRMWRVRSAFPKYQANHDNYQGGGG